jgi:hypothetical protein
VGPTGEVPGEARPGQALTGDFVQGALAELATVSAEAGDVVVVATAANDAVVHARISPVAGAEAAAAGGGVRNRPVALRPRSGRPRDPPVGRGLGRRGGRRGGALRPPVAVLGTDVRS